MKLLQLTAIYNTRSGQSDNQFTGDMRTGDLIVNPAHILDVTWAGNMRDTERPVFELRLHTHGGAVFRHYIKQSPAMVKDLASL